MKMLSSLFLIGLLCLASTLQTRSHHTWEPNKFFSSVAEANSSDLDDGVFMTVQGTVAADGVELGAYYIDTTGIVTKTKQRRFCGSASASSSGKEDGFFYVAINASIGGRFYDGNGDADGDFDEAGDPDQRR